jgi:hypothetical protein
MIDAAVERCVSITKNSPRAVADASMCDPELPLIRSAQQKAHPSGNG